MILFVNGFLTELGSVNIVMNIRMTIESMTKVCKVFLCRMRFFFDIINLISVGLGGFPHCSSISFGLAVADS